MLSFVSLFLIFFSYIPGVFTSDVQPFYLVSYAFLAYQLKIDKKLLYLALFLVSLSLIITFSRYDTLYVKSYMVHFIFVFNVIFFMNLKNITAKVFLLFLLIHLIVVFFQYAYDAKFLAGLVSRSVDNIANYASAGRGVRGLAPEPSQLGLMLFYIVCISYFVFDWARFRVIFLVVFLFNIVMIQSSFALLFYVLMFSFCFVSLKDFKHIVLFVVAGVGSLYFFVDVDSRVITVVSAIFNDPDFLYRQGAFVKLLNPIISLEIGLGIPFVSFYFPGLIGESFYETDRFFGGLSELVLNYGVLGLLINIILFSIVYRKLSTVEGRKIFIVFYICIFCTGTLFNPLIAYTYSRFYSLDKSYRVNDEN